MVTGTAQLHGHPNNILFIGYNLLNKRLHKGILDIYKWIVSIAG